MGFALDRRGLRRTIAVMASLLAQACASTAQHEASTVPASDRDEARVAELDRRVRELEAGLATSGSSNGASHRTTRIAAPERTALYEEDVEIDAPPAHDSSAPVVLRLHEERQAQLPVVTERLPVVPMAALPPMAAAPMAAAPIAATSVPANAATTLPNAGGSLDSLLATMQPAASSGATSTTNNATSPANPPGPETHAYRAGVDHLVARRYEAAIASLSSFLRDYPGSMRAADAMYWRATANYALHRYEDALVDYERVPRVAPRSDHAADALYQSGLCHRRLGAAAQARSAFARVRRDYPDSAAAQLAAREGTT